MQENVTDNKTNDKIDLANGLSIEHAEPLASQDERDSTAKQRAILTDLLNLSANVPSDAFTPAGATGPSRKIAANVAQSATRQIATSYKLPLPEQLSATPEEPRLADIAAMAVAAEIRNIDWTNPIKTAQAVMSSIAGFYDRLAAKKPSEFLGAAEKAEASAYVSLFAPAFQNLAVLMEHSHPKDQANIRMYLVKLTYLLLSIPKGFLFEKASTLKSQLEHDFFINRIERDRILSAEAGGAYPLCVDLQPGLRDQLATFVNQKEYHGRYSSWSLQTAVCIDSMIKQIAHPSLHKRDVFCTEKSTSSEKRILFIHQGRYFTITIDLRDPPSVLELAKSMDSINSTEMDGQVTEDPYVRAAIKRILYQMLPHERPQALQELFGSQYGEVPLVVSSVVESDRADSDVNLIRSLLSATSLEGTSGNTVPIHLILQYSEPDATKNGAQILRRFATFNGHSSINGIDAARITRYLNCQLFLSSFNLIKLGSGNANTAMRIAAARAPAEEDLPPLSRQWLDAYRNEQIKFVPNPEIISEFTIDYQAYAQLEQQIGKIIKTHKEKVYDAQQKRVRKRHLQPGDGASVLEPSQFGFSFDSLLSLAALVATDGAWVAQALGARAESEDLYVHPVSIEGGEIRESLTELLKQMTGHEQTPGPLATVGREPWSATQKRIQQAFETGDTKTDAEKLTRSLVESVLIARRDHGELFTIFSELAMNGSIEKILGNISKYVLRLIQEEIFNNPSAMTSSMVKGYRGQKRPRVYEDIRAAFGDYMQMLRDTDQFRDPPLPLELVDELIAQHFSEALFFTAQSERFQPKTESLSQTVDDALRHGKQLVGVVGAFDQLTYGEAQVRVTLRFPFESLIPDIVRKFDPQHQAAVKEVCIAMAVGNKQNTNNTEVPQLLRKHFAENANAFMRSINIEARTCADERALKTKRAMALVVGLLSQDFSA